MTPRVLLAGWILLPILILTLQWSRGDHFPVLQILSTQIGYWGSWAFLTPLVFRLGQRFPLHSRNAPLHVLLHLGASAVIGLALALLIMVLTAIFWSLGNRPDSWLTAGLTAASVYVPFSAVVYWLVLAVGRGIAGYQQSRQRDLLLAEARLAALKAQVHPHFLFNALNSVSGLIDEDPEAAQEMIARLSELLRASLHQRHAEEHTAQEVPLRDELHLVRLYLDIEQVRFDRLKVNFDIDEDAQSALVPQLLLQPLVENAILHGISRSSTSGDLSISACVKQPVLTITIRDDGPGVDRPDDEPISEGIGLGTTGARLKELYGDTALLRLSNRQPRGAEVRVELPLRHRLGAEV